ncbi:DUF1134 domain-containing protein [Altericroceibacterium xinjiangense]|uniref:DUF1134 domain-containing protein n=1 Tax=Altericroceibacterium xinjiangense TaxID=762261 RepID=UPI0019D30FC2|nr:DUF1134 domain-containing protein [Altericroceibacterium xinjiangense]
MIKHGAFRRLAISGLLAASVGLGSIPVAAQVRTIDPNAAIDGDLAQPEYSSPVITPAPAYQQPELQPEAPIPAPAPPAPAAPAQPALTASAGETYREDDLIGAAEGVFGKGAEGLARLIEDILQKQGEPNGYIVGREAGGAFIFGLRYGSGTLFHKVEGQRPVYWTGPSVGFDAGANAANTFVLVYNLYDSEELYERFPAGEGDAYVVGGLTASYLRKGNLVLIPIRVGAGLRLGINAGYMKFSKEQKWMPF